MPPTAETSAAAPGDQALYSFPPIGKNAFSSSAKQEMPSVKETISDRPDRLNDDSYSLPQIETAVSAYSFSHSLAVQDFRLNSVPHSANATVPSVLSNQSNILKQGREFGGTTKGGYGESFIKPFRESDSVEKSSDDRPTPGSKIQDVLTKHRDNVYSNRFHTSAKISNGAEKDSLASEMVTKTPSSDASAPDTTEPNTPDSLSASQAASEANLRRLKRSNASNADHVSYQFFHVEPCLYTHRMFIRAATIFKVLKDSETETVEAKAARRRQQVAMSRGLSQAVIEVPKEKIPDMEFKDAHEQIKTFELTFAALKYQTLFRDILDKTVFFHDFPSFREFFGLVCIVLYDLQSRKFQRRQPFPDEELDEVCQEIEDGLLSRKTRLLSTMAKERIKYNAPSLEYLLPEQVRDKDETKSKIPVYIWVNHFKRQMSDFIAELEADGFTQAEADADLSEVTERLYRVDPHCTDLLSFPPHWAMHFKDSDWLKQGILVQQDKSSCLAPQSVQYILGTDHDVIHVNVGTGMTTGHLASLLRAQSCHAHVWGFGVDGPEKLKKVNKNLETLGVRNTKILLEDFLTVDPEDPRFKNVKVILITANCSKSAITSPVQFIVSEGEDMQILGELSKAEYDMQQIGEKRTDHLKTIAQALRFPKLRAVVYATRSRYEAENEGVVSAALEAFNETHNRRLPFKVTPPVLPFTAEEIDTEMNGVEGRYIRFTPSDKSNGCFVAVISKEPDDPKDVTKSALARARSKGLLGKSSSKPNQGEGHNQSGDVSGPAEPEANLKPTKSGTAPNKPRKLKTAASVPEIKSHNAHLTQRSKSLTQKPAAIGARLYQAGLIAKMQQSPPRTRANKPEHMKVVKHPAPFSNEAIPAKV